VAGAWRRWEESTANDSWNEGSQAACEADGAGRGVKTVTDSAQQICECEGAMHERGVLYSFVRRAKIDRLLLCQVHIRHDWTQRRKMQRARSIRLYRWLICCA
jgi:hypothetical protein